jgi:hypothetical protein
MSTWKRSACSATHVAVSSGTRVLMLVVFGFALAGRPALLFRFFVVIKFS